jgi:ABC-2 type transport system ATP-binding protein
VAVRTVGLTREYAPGVGLFDVDLEVPRGGVYGLVGPNGAGKTTLLSILAGLRHADRGSVELALDRRRLALCPDVPEFEPWLTAYEVVDLARSLVAPRAGAFEVRRALVTAGLAESAYRRVGGFSRGMTQRLGLAAALVGDPELVVLDEPTSALDPAGRAEILDLVGAMRGRRTVVFSSHILADVQRVADVVGVLRGGRLMYQGSMQALVDEHLTPRWSLRLASPVEDAARAFAGAAWVTHIAVTGPDTLRVDARSLTEGEIGLPAVLAASQARLVSCEPLAADLESAFLALTGEVRS